MIRCAAILLLLALTPATLAEEASSYAQLAPTGPTSLEAGGGAGLLPAPVANGTVLANDTIHLASHEESGDLPSTVPDEGVNTPTAAQAQPNHIAATRSTDNARLLRRSDSPIQAEGQGANKEQEATSPAKFLASDAATTAAAATALVVGLFLVCAWMLKRGMPKSSRVLPREAVEILGRCPLGNKQFAHLIHVGNKVILVNVTANGAETLAEVDDPNEVVRILGVCTASGPGSASKEFDAIFQQFAKEPAPKGFLGGESTGYSSAASTYSQNAEGARRG